MLLCGVNGSSIRATISTAGSAAFCGTVPRTMREGMDTLECERLREFLAGLVEPIVLDPVAETLAITYRLAAEGRVKLASPAGFEPAYLP